MERNVLEYPLARSKSELALRYFFWSRYSIAHALCSVDVVDLGIDRLNKVNLCKHCFNFDLRIAATIYLAILHKSPYLIISNEGRKIMISSVTTTQLTDKLYMLPADIKILTENR